MQGNDLLTLVVPASTSETTLVLTQPAPERERWLSPWTMDPQPLRYDVTSLEHWLDLNA
jgi:hypothetical protein